MSTKSDYNLPYLKIVQKDMVFQSPWHSQLFAMTIQLSNKEIFYGMNLLKFLVNH